MFGVIEGPEADAVAGLERAEGVVVAAACVERQFRVYGSPRSPGAIGQLEVGLALKGVLRRGSLQDGEGPSVAIEPELLFPFTAVPSGFGLAAGVIVSQRWPALTVHLNLVPAWSRAHQPAGLAGSSSRDPSTGWCVRWARRTSRPSTGCPRSPSRGWSVSSGVLHQAWRSTGRYGLRRSTVRA